MGQHSSSHGTWEKALVCMALGQRAKARTRKGEVIDDRWEKHGVNATPRRYMTLAPEWSIHECNDVVGFAQNLGERADGTQRRRIIKGGLRKRLDDDGACYPNQEDDGEGEVGRHD